MTDIVERLRDDKRCGCYADGGESFTCLYCEAADELDRLRSLTEWRTIDSAPKDGTPFLIARLGEEVGDGEFEITRWCVSKRFHYEQVEGDMFRKVDDEPYEFWDGNGHRATHWLPLPPPPQTKE